MGARGNSLGFPVFRCAKLSAENMNLGPVQLFQPVWLLLLIPVLCSLWVWKIPSRFLTILRVLFLLLIVFAMCEPMLKLPTRSGTVVAVVDLSRSMPPESRGESVGAINLILEHRGVNDKAGVVSFGALPFPEMVPGSERSFSSFSAVNSPDASDLFGAVEQAISLIPPHEKGRILLITDGRFTGENPINLTSRLIQRDIAVDYRLLERSPAGDVAVGSLEAPQLVSPEEAFTISADVRVPVSQTVQYELLRDGSIISSGQKDMGMGENRLVFRDRAGQGGTLTYQLRINGELVDPVPENNSARRLVGVDGVKPLLVLAQRTPSGELNTQLPTLFRGSGIDTIATNAAEIPFDLPLLSGFSGIVVENVPASDLGNHSMELIGQWVRQTGSGLLFSGGKNSYALGGYYKSPLDEIMPVSMELRQEHRKLALAIVAVLDRSGSMAAPASMGRTKMDLANIATADLLKILTPLDEIGVIAVDSAPHTIVPLHPNNSPDKDRSEILRVQSMGGGIFVYTGLRAAVDMLRKSSVGTKHIILFADAADAEEPGDYVRLLDICDKAGITCSVIGLGSPTDVDANFLRDVARRGKGQVYFTTDATELPRFFAQDTFVIARSTFIESPVEISWTAGLSTLLGQHFPQPPKIGGYNLCYLKAGALPSARSEDDYKAPILASWQAGLGRVACYTAQIDGDYTGRIARWEEYSNFLASLGRWTAGRMDKLPNNMLLTQEIVEGSLRIHLDLDPEREEASLDTVPRITLLRQTANQPLETQVLSMRWLEAERLGAVVPLTGSETILATVDFGKPAGAPEGAESRVISLPPACLPYSPEFRPQEPGKGRDLLIQLADSTGGVERMEMSGIWKDIPRIARYHAFAHWLLITAIVLLILEVFDRRTGWISGWLRRLHLERTLSAAIRKQPQNAEDSEEKESESVHRKGTRISWLQQLRLSRSRKKSEEPLSKQENAVPGIAQNSQSPRAEESSEAFRKEKAKTPGKAGMLGALDRAKRSANKRTKL